MEVVLKIGSAFAEVYTYSYEIYEADFFSQLSSPAKIVVELAKTLFEVIILADGVTRS